jgi:hypothetical protein
MKKGRIIVAVMMAALAMSGVALLPGRAFAEDVASSNPTYADCEKEKNSNGDYKSTSKIKTVCENFEAWLKNMTASAKAQHCDPLKEYGGVIEQVVINKCSVYLDEMLKNVMDGKCDDVNAAATCASRYEWACTSGNVKNPVTKNMVCNAFLSVVNNISKENDPKAYESTDKLAVNNTNKWEGTTSSSSSSGATQEEYSPPTGNDCANILGMFCQDDDAGAWGVFAILKLVVDILTVGVGVLATIGIVMSAIQYLTARDKEDQAKKARTRIVNIVIGMVMWGVMYIALNFLMPGGIWNGTGG